MDEEEYWFSEHGSGMNTVYWSWFFAALMEEAMCLDRVYGNDDFATAYAYAFDARQSFETVPLWRLRAAENYHCGVFDPSPRWPTSLRCWTLRRSQRGRRLQTSSGVMKTPSRARPGMSRSGTSEAGGCARIACRRRVAATLSVDCFATVQVRYVSFMSVRYSTAP